MKLPIRCFECTEDQGSGGHIALVEFRDDGRYEATCPRGHRTTILLQEQLFELLFEIGAYAIRDGYYREAVSSFTASLERFYEFFLRAVLSQKGVAEEWVDISWNMISKQSERQLGAFIVLSVAELGNPPQILPPKQVEFRNSVIHRGEIPSKHEAMAYGQIVLDLIRPLIQILKAKYPAGTGLTIQRNMTKARKKDDKVVGAMHIPTIVSLVSRGDEYDNRPLALALEQLPDWETRVNAGKNIMTGR
jgi:hypothetical protein